MTLQRMERGREGQFSVGREEGGSPLTKRPRQTARRQEPREIFQRVVNSWAPSGRKMGYGAAATAAEPSKGDREEEGEKKKEATATDTLFSIKLNFFPGTRSLHLSLDGADGSPQHKDQVFGQE